MGYRTYLSIIEKEKLDKNKLNNFNYKFKIASDIYEFGKYFDSSESLIILENYSNEDTEFYIISPESFLSIIEEYKKIIIDYFKSLLDNSDNEDEYFHESIEDHIKDKIRRWERTGVVNLNLEKQEIVSSWLIEYGIFEIVRLYKTFDSNKYYLVYRGY